jgi:hypothetical protein
MDEALHKNGRLVGNMRGRTRLSPGPWLYRFFLGGRARQICGALLLLLLVLSIALRVHSFVLTRKIHAVLSGLQQVRVDVTTEDQLVKAVPFLTLDRARRVQSGEGRRYRVEISNSYHDLRWTRWAPSFLFTLWPGSGFTETTVKDKWNFLSLPAKVAYLLGWRNLSFRAYVTVLNRTVTATGYDIEPDIVIAYPLSYFVVARSAHGFFARGPVPLHSTDDESPEYRFGAIAGEFSMLPGADSAIAVAYTAEAPSDRISHVFQVDLSCFWSVRGCDSVRQVVPLLWKDRKAIEEATAARLTSAKPCPDRILAGRVRYLLDLNVALLEVVDSRSEVANYEGDRSYEIVTDYRLKEALRGHPEGPWTAIRYRQGIPWMLAPTGQIANPIRPSLPRPGDRFLYFSGATFDSCRIVPATPSAESAVRTTVPAPRRPEDDVGFMWGRM